MKIELKKNGCKIFFKFKDSVKLTEEQLGKILKFMDDAINNMTNISTSDKVKIDDDKIKTENIIPINKNERPAFRDRLPNNVVDIDNLTIKQAITENTLVRCPKCGQSHAVIVKDNTGIYLMRKDYQKNEFIAIAEYSPNDNSFTDSCCTSDTDRKAYFEDLQSLSELPDITQFNVTNETELFCPVCCESNKFRLWKDAYEDPLNFFETEHLCDACGGEIVEKIVKDKSIAFCEKCGLEQEVRYK